MTTFSFYFHLLSWDSFLVGHSELRSKQLYLPNPSVNTVTHAPLEHTRSAPSVMPKNMNSVADSGESHDNYQCAYSIGSKFRF